MKKNIAALLLLSASIPALAGDYESAVGQQSVCENMGKIGAMYYKLKEQGSPYDVSFVDANTLSGKLTVKIADYGYHRAIDLKDSYMRGWAMCMDTFEARK